MKEIQMFLLTATILLVIDIVWITLFIGRLFGTMVLQIQKTPMQLNPFGGLIAYLLLIIGVYQFGVKNIDPERPFISSIMNGGLFGLVSYGLFDFTNMAIFKDYNLSVAIIDTLWGGVIGTIVPYLVYKIYGA